MTGKRLHSKAWVVLILTALYNIADSFCSVFVGVYFYVNSMDFRVVCYHYLALYIVTPIVFILAGWYSQRHDRVHVYRLGLLLHAVYYGTLLLLREASVDYAMPLGALLGVTWGCFWSGNNTFNFDMSQSKKREYFFGWLYAIANSARLVAPMLSGLIIHYAGEGQRGYQIIFSLAVVIYLIAIGFSVLIPPDKTRRPFKIKRALFPGKDQRDWRLVMLASATQTGAFHIFSFLLAVIMYLQTGSEIAVGSFAVVQALISIIMSYFIGRIIVPGRRRIAIKWGAIIIFAGGALVAWELNVYTLIIFGFMRAVSNPLYSIPQSGVRMDVIAQSAETPAQRIEYLSAWEVPLAIGRLISITALILMSSYILNDVPLRVIIFLLSFNRILTYWVVSQTSILQAEKR